MDVSIKLATLQICEFTYTISHDSNNPIAGFLDQLVYIEFIILCYYIYTICMCTEPTDQPVYDVPCMGADYKAHIRPMLDLVDNLRELGIDHDISLPSIVVVGDQSAGKSSVLEALSGVQLPRGTGIEAVIAL